MNTEVLRKGFGTAAGRSAQIAAYHKACRDAADELDRLRAFIAAVHSRMHGPALTEATRRMLIAECEKEIPELGTIKTPNAEITGG